MSENKSNRCVVAMAALGGAALLLAGVASSSSAATIALSAKHSDVTGMGIYSKTTAMVGEAVTWQWVGHKTSGRVFRYVATFTLPDIPSGQTIQNVTFTIPLSSITGTPVGDAVLYHLPNANHPTVWPGDFGATASPVSGVSTLVTPTSTTKKDYSLDVTTDVLSDYANDTTTPQYAAFRIEIPSDDDLSGTSDDFYFFGDSTLTITTVPEPAGLSLLGLAGLAMLRRRKGA